jgi:hypothetical protein
MLVLSKKHLVGLLLVIAAPILIYGWVFRGQWSGDPGDWANFATYVAGTVAVVIGAFGFYALLLTLKLQQFQLDRLSEEAQSQEFERRLEGLLVTLGEVLRETDIRQLPSGAVVARGRDAFKNLFRRKLKRIYKPYELGNHLVDDRTAVRQSFDELYRRSGSDFGHYFRTLYHCVLLVDEQVGLTKAQRKKYFDLIFCRLSKFELILLFYNGLGSIGERKFKPLIERHGLLEHVDVSLLMSSEHWGYYEVGAWNGQQ